MVGSTGTLMTMRLVRSKLRKREETSAVSPPTNGRTTTTTTLHEAHNNHNNNILNSHHQQIHMNNLNNYRNSNYHRQSSDHQLTISATITSQQQHQQVLQTTNSDSAITNGTLKQQPQEDNWVFPPLPPQPNIYCLNTLEAMNNLKDESGFKRIKHQFSGRFKRILAKKTHDAPAIPPELRPQLKTIYVY